MTISSTNKTAFDRAVPDESVATSIRANDRATVIALRLEESGSETTRSVRAKLRTKGDALRFTESGTDKELPNRNIPERNALEPMQQTLLENVERPEWKRSGAESDTLKQPRLLVTDAKSRWNMSKTGSEDKESNHVTPNTERVISQQTELLTNRRGSR